MQVEDHKLLPFHRSGVSESFSRLSVDSHDDEAAGGLDWLEPLRWFAAGWWCMPVNVVDEPASSPLMSLDEAERLCRRLLRYLSFSCLAWHDIRLCQHMVEGLQMTVDELVESGHADVPAGREILLAQVAVQRCRQRSRRAHLLFLIASRTVIRRMLFHAAESALDALVLLRRSRPVVN